MTKAQRYTYEMLVRVRNFGTEQASQFPEASAIVGKFTQVAGLVTAIEMHLKNHTLSMRGVKSSTKEAVVGYLKAIASAGRRVTGDERNRNPFILPRRRNLAVVLATARGFLDEAAQRQEQFVEFGLPPTFISDLTTLVDGLEGAQSTHLDSKTMRANAQAGIRAAVREGVLLVRDLDVLMQIAPQVEEVLTATWKAARRIEGQASSSASPKVGGAEGEEPVAAPEAPPAAASTTTSAVASGNVTTVEAPVLVLEKAS